MTHIDGFFPVSQALPHCGWVNSSVNKQISEKYLTRPYSKSHISDFLSAFHHKYGAQMLHTDMHLPSTGV